MPVRAPFLVAAMTGLLLAPAVRATAQGSADLAIAKRVAPDPVTVGDSLRATITVTNNGPDPADGVVVNDSIPSNASVGRADASQGSCSVAATSVTCSLGTLADGAEATVVVVVAPLMPGRVDDTASVSSNDADPDPSNNSANGSAMATGSPCTATGTWSDDQLTGTSGDDTLCGLGGDDLLVGGPGDDHLYGGAGTDTVSYEGAGKPIHASLRAGTAAGEGADELAQIEDLVGSGDNDVLSGDDNVNGLTGGAGNDVLYGREGDDRLDGGDDGDFLAGGAGRDQLTGGPGDDTCVPGADGGFRADACLGRSRPDRNDTRGTFDLADATMVAGRTASIRVRTFAPWSVYGMWDSGQFIVWLDTQGDEEPDLYVLVRADRDRFVGALFRRSATGDVHRFRVRVRHPSRHTIAISLPLARVQFPKGRAYFGWWVQSMWDASPCANVCFDRVDDEGEVPEARP